MNTVLLTLRDNSFTLLFSLLFSAFVGWFFSYCAVDVVADIATKHGRKYLKREYCSDALSVGVTVFVALVLLVLVLAALELETWVRGRATVFVVVLALTFAICGWSALRSNGVPFNVLLAGVVVGVCAIGFWYLLAESGYTHPIAAVIQATILVAFNPSTIYWVQRQYSRPYR